MINFKFPVKMKAIMITSQVIQTKILTDLQISQKFQNSKWKEIELMMFFKGMPIMLTMPRLMRDKTRLTTTRWRPQNDQIDSHAITDLTTITFMERTM